MTLLPATDARSNRLLAMLPAADWQRWQPLLEAVDLPVGRVLTEAGMATTHAYFPATAVVSLMYLTEQGASTQIGMVGNEGMVGLALVMGGGSTSSRAVVTSPGSGFRLPAGALVAAFNQSPVVAHLLLRYAQAMITQLAQTAVCNRHHALDQQLCRWLLQTLDRVPGHEVTATHEAIGQMLGVRREGVTEAARKLQAAGLVRYARGRITVLDRAGLQQRSCECYAVVQKECDRLLRLPGF
ncbi:MAG: Crp/Fnr family transcriptional regulator [Aquabacterium sp.]|nr:Crp/Fnr family transcriptional regulator [Aquabacterium sp.]